MSGQIFLSYKAQDRELTLKIKKRIEASGYSCWMAPLSIPGGSSYAAEIENAIRNCKALVLVFSEAAMQSKWVEKEVDRAINQNKLILPLRTEEFELNAAFSYYLTNVQFYEAFYDYDAALAQLIERIGESCEADLPVVPPAPAVADRQSEAAKPEEETRTAEADVAPGTSEEIPVLVPPHNEKKPEEKKNEKTSRIKNKRKAIILASAAVLVLAAAIVLLAVFRDDLAVTYTIGDEKVKASSEYLDIRNHTLTDADISHINRMKELRRIRLVNCGLSDDTVNMLKAFRSDYGRALTEVNLSGNKGITNFGFLKNTADIKYLNVSETGITDFSGFDVAGNRYLEVAVLADGCAISSFQGLQFKNEGLSLHLSFNDCGLDDERAAELGRILEETDTVKGVDVGNNPLITDLSFLRNCTGLTELNVSDTGIADLRGLEKCIYLEKLNARDCGIASLRGLENMTLLSMVLLSNNRLSGAEVSVLKQSAAAVKYLFLDGNPLADGSFADCADAVKAMDGLEMLDMSGASITDASFLNGKNQLVWLRLSHNGLTELDCVGPMTELKYLDVSDNRLASLDLVRLPTALRCLDVSNNGIAFDAVALNADGEEHAQMDYLDIHGNTYKKISLDGWFDFVTLDYCEGVDYKAVKGTVLALKMIGCPLSKQVSVSDIFGSRIEYASEADYDGFVSGQILQEGEQMLYNKSGGWFVSDK